MVEVVSTGADRAGDAFPRVSDQRSGGRGAVVITGTSTGIGAATAVHLAETGFHVFAGVRREADGETLQAQTSEPLTPLIIDVTDEKTISAAASTVADAVGDRGLVGLVNNAGIAKPAPLEFQPMADFRMQLEVNLFGPVAMIQAFLPLIRRGAGRIVNVGSIGGMLVLPLNGAYSASKFGMQGDQRCAAARAPAVEHPCLADRGRARQVSDLRQDLCRARRARGDARRDRLRPVRAADRRHPQVAAEGGGRRRSAAGHREGSRPRAHLGQAEDPVSGRPRRQAGPARGGAPGPGA